MGNTPNIRFKGFTDDWEQRKLGEMGITFTGLSGKTADDFGHGEASFITYMNVFSNPVANPKMVEKVEIDAKQKEVQVGDVFFTTSSETPEEVGMSCVLKEKQGVTYLNSFCFGYRPTEKFDLDYLAYMLRSDNVRKDITFLAQGISRYNISKNKVMDIAVPVPKFDEQQQIGSYFSNLDHLITLHQRKCDETKELKKFMLQKMFPKKGEKKPEIRFAGFTDDWEQRKVLDLLIQPVTDGPHETPELVEEGVPFISVDAIVDNKIDFSRKRGNISEKYDELCCKKYKPQLHDVYLVKSGSTVGKVAIVETTEKFNIWSPLAAMRCGDKTYPYFLYNLLQTKDLQAQVADKASNGTQPNLSMRELEKFPVCVPSNIEEQKKIGAYFEQLDNLITLHQRKCDEAKELKKFMLQNMFV